LKLSLSLASVLEEKRAPGFQGALGIDN
jgi:hypothetical protein